MLLESQGVFEPRACYHLRILTNWHRQMTIGIGPTPQVLAYWASASRDQGRPKGPIHQVILALKECDVTHTVPTNWHIPSLCDTDILRLTNPKEIFGNLRCGLLGWSCSDTVQAMQGSPRGLTTGPRCVSPEHSNTKRVNTE